MDNGEGDRAGHVQVAALGQPEPRGGQQLVRKMAGTGGENIGEFGQSRPFGGGPGDGGGGILDDQRGSSCSRGGMPAAYLRRSPVNQELRGPPGPESARTRRSAAL